MEIYKEEINFMWQRLVDFALIYNSPEKSVLKELSFKTKTFSKVFRIFPMGISIDSTGTSGHISWQKQ